MAFVLCIEAKYIIHVNILENVVYLMMFLCYLKRGWLDSREGYEVSL